MIKTTKINKADIIGILSSSICLVHCIATPLLIIYGIGFMTNPIFKSDSPTDYQSVNRLRYASVDLS